MWIAHISDCHIRPAGESYKNVVDPAAALAEAIQQINDLRPRPDLVVLTGDLVDEADPAEYAEAHRVLSALQVPLRLIPGNHDNRSTMRAAFHEHSYLQGTGPLHYVDEATGPVRVVGFDVTVPGHHHGAADQASLNWLHAALADAPDRPTVILMHQPPLDCDVPYLDRYNCRHARGLADLVRQFPAVERILCGHVHRTMQMRFAGTLLCTAPSTATAIALRPFSDASPASYAEPPGFLLHHWRPEHGMLTHSIPIGRFPGPFPFA